MMTTYKNKIILGDTYTTLKVLPDKIVDVGITSPPYNKQEKNDGGLVSNVVYNGFIDKLSEQEYQRQQIEVLNEIYRITKSGGSFFYNHKIRWVKGDMFHPMDWLRKTRWAIKQEIVWNRKIAGNIRGWRFWQVEERIYWLYKPIKNNKIGKELLSKDAKLTSIWHAVPENNNPHPAPYPLWLPARVILSILGSENKGLVLDPYVGSGTTCVASKLLGFDFIGIDISKAYTDYARKRVSNCSKEIEEINKEKHLHTIKKTFSERKANGEYVPKKDRQRKLVL